MTGMSVCDIHRKVAEWEGVLSLSHEAGYECPTALSVFRRLKTKGEAGVGYESLRLLAAEGFSAFRKYIP